LRKFWWIGEQHGSFWGFGSARRLLTRHADAITISQKTSLTETTDDAVFGADWARMGIFARWNACRTARVEFFVGWAFGNGWKLHWNIVFTTFAFQGANAFAFEVLQETLFTETTDDTLESTECWWFWISAIWNTSRSAFVEFGIGTAFFIDWERRGGNSEFEGAKTDE